MAEEKWKEGDSAIYRGIMECRRGQQVEIVMGGELLSCRFPDGAVIGCAPSSLRQE